tara:strand:+ start:829 stop:1686 length:858 start_codon:yes stop_codon:yes gene_type:complete
VSVYDFEIYEVGPRDGLQSKDTIISTAHKVELIEQIAMSGIRKIEVGSLVHPEKVPNMADSDVLFKQLPHLQYDCELAMLVPNKQGVDRAKKIGVENFNVFFSPSENFNMSNHGRVSSQIFTEYCAALEGVPKDKVRVYLSCMFGCPYSGGIHHERMETALRWAESLGDTIVLADTIGNADPTLIRSAVDMTRSLGIKSNLALHLHHGRRKNRMFDNLSTAFDLGIREFDSSIGGMGGCPFVPGSGGNLATEDLVKWGKEEGLNCGVKPEDLGMLSEYVEKTLKH